MSGIGQKMGVSHLRREIVPRCGGEALINAAWLQLVFQSQSQSVRWATDEKQKGMGSLLKSQSILKNGC